MALGSDFFSNTGGAVRDIFSAYGSFQSAGGYSAAAKAAERNADLTREETEVKLAQQQRTAFQVLGGQKADIASAGFLESGSALDIMRDSASQAALSKAMIDRQGDIKAEGFEAQAKMYRAMADASESSGWGSIISSGIRLLAGFGGLA